MTGTKLSMIATWLWVCPGCYSVLGVDTGLSVAPEARWEWGWRGGGGVELGAMRVELAIEGLAQLDGAASHSGILSIGYEFTGNGPSGVSFESSGALGMPLGWDSSDGAFVTGAGLSLPIGFSGRRSDYERNRSLAWVSRRALIVPAIRYRAITPVDGSGLDWMQTSHHLRAGVELRWRFGTELLE